MVPVRPIDGTPFFCRRHQLSLDLFCDDDDEKRMVSSSPLETTSLSSEDEEPKDKKGFPQYRRPPRAERHLLQRNLHADVLWGREHIWGIAWASSTQSLIIDEDPFCDDDVVIRIESLSFLENTSPSFEENWMISSDSADEDEEEDDFPSSSATSESGTAPPSEESAGFVAESV
mmetsp:Transcript_38891/g.62997  ORF Transcript_38891/g.62997 Transcript_38891/m.62997 type:complete len:174 (+) Transcript_38891:277-798(+)